MKLKEPLTFENQVKRLEEHGMFVASEESAIDFLSNVNYYRFTGYAVHFRAPNHQDYIKGTSFETVRQLYLFDAELRALYRKYLDIAEALLRTRIAYYFSMEKCAVPPHDGHYDPANFYRPELHQRVLDSLVTEENRRPDSKVVLHHRSQYSGKMPLWVMVEFLSLSSLALLYRAMYFSEQKKIADSFHQKISFFKNHVHVLTVLRNKCAHGSRLYGVPFNPPSSLGASYQRKHPEVRLDTLFAATLILLRYIPDVTDQRQFVNALYAAICHYGPYIDLSMIGFPANYATLLEDCIK